MQSLTANLALIDYHLTVTIDPEGSGSVSGEGTYNMGEEVTLEATANDGYEFISRTDGEGIVSEETVYILTMPTEDVTLTANFSEATAIFEEGISTQIHIYPNPAKDFINIAGIKNAKMIEIFSIDGRPVLNLGGNNMHGVSTIGTTGGLNEKTSIDISHLKPGIYIIRINFNNQNISHRIVVN